MGLSVNMIIRDNAWKVYSSTQEGERELKIYILTEMVVPSWPVGTKRLIEKKNSVKCFEI